MMGKRNYILIILVLVFQNVFSQEAKDTVSIYDRVGFFNHESMPVFNGNLKSFIQRRIIYPKSALHDSAEGRVFVNFWVDALGKTIDHKIVSKLRNDLDQEALRVSKLIRFDKPAMRNGKPIKVEYTLMIEFKLPKNKK